MCDFYSIVSEGILEQNWRLSRTKKVLNYLKKKKK